MLTAVGRELHLSERGEAFRGRNRDQKWGRGKERAEECIRGGVEAEEGEVGLPLDGHSTFGPARSTAT